MEYVISVLFIYEEGRGEEEGGRDGEEVAAECWNEEGRRAAPKSYAQDSDDDGGGEDLEDGEASEEQVGEDEEGRVDRKMKDSEEEDPMVPKVDQVVDHRPADWYVCPFL